MAQNPYNTDNPYKSPGPSFSESRGFSGVDLWTNPQDLTGNYLLQADNCLNVAGQLYIRPGRAGLFGGAAPSSSSSSSGSPQSSSSSSSYSSYIDIGGTGYGVLGNPNYALCDFDDSLDNNWLLFGSGGKVYKTLQDSGAHTELLNAAGVSYGFDTPNLDAARLGDFAYLVDGQSPLTRLSLNGGFPAYAMLAETVAPVATLVDASTLPAFSAGVAAYDAPPQYTRGVGVALATANLSGSTISTVTVNNGGFGYGANVPLVTIVDNVISSPGTGATAHAVLTSGSVSSVVVDTAGTGYTNPVVVFTSASTTPANAFSETWTPNGGHNWANALAGLGWSAANLPFYGTGAGGPAGSMASLGAPAFYDTDANDGTTPLQWVEFDSAVSTLTSTSGGIKAIQNVQHGDGSAEWAGQFALAFAYFQDNIHAGVTVSCQPFSDYKATNALAAPKTFNFQPKAISSTSIGSFPFCATIFDFSEISQTTPIKSWQIIFTGNPSIVPPSGTLNHGLLIAYITGGGIWGNLTAAASGAWQAQMLPSQVVAGGWIGNTFADDFIQSAPLTNLTKDARLRTAYGSGASCTVTVAAGKVTNLSAFTGGTDYLDGTVITFTGGGGTGASAKAVVSGGAITGFTGLVGGDGYATAPTAFFGQSFLGNEFVNVPLTGFVNGNMLAFAFSNNVIELRLYDATTGNYQALELIVDPSGAFAQGDLTALVASEIACVSAATIRFVDNPTAGLPPFTFTIGELTFAGNLIPGDANYQWYVTETAVINATNSIESNPSPVSNALDPGGAALAANVVIGAGAPMNAPTTNYNFYRIGGTLPDIRLVAQVPVNADVKYGTDPLNPYYSWNHTTKTFFDNTPDLWLTLAPLMSFSKDPMPANAQAVATWQDRLWEAVGNILYASWLPNAAVSAALMTTITQDTGDPNYAVAGWNAEISPDPTDTVVRLIPFGTPAGVSSGNGGSNEFGGGLLVLCKRSVYMIQGQDASSGPTGFSVHQYDYTAQVGLVARRGVARISANLLYFMGPDRLHAFPPQADDIKKDIGLIIQPALYPVSPQPLQATSAFSQSWMLFHDYKLYLGVPTPGGSAPAVIWIYDFRMGGWTRWTGTATLPMAITSALSEPPNTGGAQYELFLFGSGGNIYRMAGVVDQETPLSATVAIPFSITVHAMRPAFFYRYKPHPLYYIGARLETAWIDMVGTLTLQMIAQAFDAGTADPVAIPGAKTIQNYQLAGGGKPFEMDMPSGLIEGTYLTVNLSGSVSDVAYLRGLRGYVSGTYIEQN